MKTRWVRYSMFLPDENIDKGGGAKLDSEKVVQELER